MIMRNRFRATNSFNLFLALTVSFLFLSHRYVRTKQSVFQEQIVFDLKAFFSNLLRIPTDTKIYASVENNVLFYRNLNIKYRVNNPKKCANHDPLVVILVDTAPDHFHKRRTIRNTWGNLSAWDDVDNDNEVLILFLTGVSKTHNDDLQTRIEEENEKYMDIIQESFLEDFHNLSIKVVSRLKWGIIHCKSARFLMKTDDDVFVNIRNLITHLNNVSPNNYYAGRLHAGSPRNVQTLSKYYVPENVYRGVYYPSYCSGGGYILSMDVVERLYAQTEHTPMLYIEDVYVGILANSAGVFPRHYNMLLGEKRVSNDLCSLSKFITSHGHRGSEMVKMYENVMSLKDLDPEFLCWGKLYSWTNPNDLLYF